MKEIKVFIYQPDVIAIKNAMIAVPRSEKQGLTKSANQDDLSQTSTEEAMLLLPSQK